MKKMVFIYLALVILFFIYGPQISLEVSETTNSLLLMMLFFIIPIFFVARCAYLPLISSRKRNQKKIIRIKNKTEGFNDFIFKYPPLRLVIVLILFSMTLLIVGSGLIYYLDFLNNEIYTNISIIFILLGSFGCFVYPVVIYTNKYSVKFPGIVFLTSLVLYSFSFMFLLTNLGDYADTRVEKLLLIGPSNTVVGTITSIKWEKAKRRSYPHPVVTFRSANGQVNVKMLNRKCLYGTCQLGNKVRVTYLIEEPRMIKVIDHIK